MLLKLAEKDYVSLLETMGSTEKEIKKRMMKRIFLTLFMLLLSLSSYLLLQMNFLLFLVIIMPVIAYKADTSTVKKEYEKYTFDQDLQFSKFMRLIVPYLKQEQSKVTLYMVFSKLLNRLEGQFKNHLFVLMNEMVAQPNDIEPFLDFARKTSNRDTNINFMMALYDFQNSSKEVSVIEDLSETANRELMKKVDEIIKRKNRGVELLPFLVAFSIMLVIMPYLMVFVLAMWNTFKM